jgi:hypothetical protein
VPYQQLVKPLTHTTVYKQNEIFPIFSTQRKTK